MGVTRTWPSREDARTADTRTLQAVALADSPSRGNILLYVRWQPSCPELSTSP